MNVSFHFVLHHQMGMHEVHLEQETLSMTLVLDLGSALHQINYSETKPLSFVPAWLFS
jgi:hypothetical protein